MTVAGQHHLRPRKWTGRVLRSFPVMTAASKDVFWQKSLQLGLTTFVQANLTIH